MSSKRRKPLFLAAAALAALWFVAGAGYFAAHRAKSTADKVLAFMSHSDPAGMTPDQRRDALKELARRLNELPPDERRRVRFEGDWNRWFNQLSEQEKSNFIESTMPSGFKQMLTSFEKLPEEKRRKTVEDALRELRRSRDALTNSPAGPEFEGGGSGTNAAPVLSEELQQKIVQIGLKTFYSDSSAQTKAELAPVLEEMQRSMERGNLPRTPHR
jgi:hypothetical protein